MPSAKKLSPPATPGRRIYSISRLVATGPRIAPHRRVDQSLLNAAAGLRARVESLEVLANNIANADTAGFKADREFYNLFLSEFAEAGVHDEVTWMPVVEGSRIDFTQGVLTPTASPLDAALNGPGFFVVGGPQGSLYTRSGNFRRSPAGRLETADGFAVMGENGPLNLPPGEVKIAEDGSLRVAQQVVGRLKIVEFANPGALFKVGRSYFQSADDSPPPATRAAVRQGHLEAANVNAAEAAVRLVEVSRQFQMITRAVALVANEMNRQAIEQLPRTGG